MAQPIRNSRIVERDVAGLGDIIERVLVNEAEVEETNIVLGGELDFVLMRRLEDAGHEDIMEGFDSVVQFEGLFCLVSFYEIFGEAGVEEGQLLSDSHNY